MKSILVPIEANEIAPWLLRRAGPLFRRPGVNVRLVSVVQTTAGHAADDAYRADRRHEALRMQLTALANELRQHRIDVEAEVLFGDPAIEVLRETANADLVVMATHGRVGLDRLRFGSVAQRVVSASPAPVLLFRPLFTENGDISMTALAQPAEFERMLVPLDGSAGAEEIVPAARLLARAFRSHVIFMTVAPERNGFEDVHRAAEYLAKWRAAFRSAGVRSEVRVREGDASERILATLEEERIDAVAMTTHGRTGLARAFLGSVAESILARTQVPMLVLRNAVLREPLPAAHERNVKVKVT